MPAKKGKGKGKAGAAGSAKSDEVKTLKAARDRLDQQLDIKSTQLMTLQEEYQRSQDLIHNLERRLRKETDSLKQELQLKIDEHAAFAEELQFELVAQQEKIKLYESQVHAAGVVVSENETLRKRVTKLNSILQSQSADHAASVHHMNSDRFNIRLQLEQAFRKALAEAKEKAQEDALEAMSEQSKKAIQLNRELTTELQTQSKGIRKMCEHFDIRDSELKSVKLQSRLNESQIKATTAELTRLARHIQQQKREMTEKDAAVQEAQAAREAAEAEAEKLRDEVEAHKRAVEEKDTYIKTMQSRIYFLSNKLNKLTSRRTRKVGTAAGKSARQRQLLSQSLPQLPGGGSRTGSASFSEAKSNGNYDHDSRYEEEEDLADGHEEDPLDPAYIWNAELHQTISPRVRSKAVRSVSYPNRDPLRLDGKRSNRTSNVSTQFVP
eukprot:INCI11281.1.p1 GENE.INCI11281.1~~INCI11281.1.p1  ORF type:complete len:438 (+),score=112.54 INCI11281.1:406-1719(+)